MRPAGAGEIVVHWHPLARLFVYRFVIRIMTIGKCINCESIPIMKCYPFSIFRYVSLVYTKKHSSPLRVLQIGKGFEFIEFESIHIKLSSIIKKRVCLLKS